ncbi:MAG: hypothetical protein JHC33_00450 [Ignisphaera sp.]|nr:hypothetical protein [Ignisphaera sp.]
MAFQGNALSIITLPGTFLGARNLSVTKEVDFEDGGFAIGSAVDGWFYQIWSARISIDKTQILLSAPNTPEFVALSGLVNCTEVSFTFDQNMRYQIAYVENDSAKFYWYDTTIPGYTTTIYGNTYKTPRVALDDKRQLETINNDIILAYTRSNNLYMRRERDRYTIEYLLKIGVPAELEKIGMNTQLRFQFKFVS